jgi:hypothetical protein
MDRSGDANNYLAHYGVKGMKWGIRSKLRDRLDSGKESARKEVKEAIKRPVTADAKVTNSSRSRIQKHGTDALSNEDLKALVTRMNLEQQYASLSQKPSVRDAGKAYLGDILADVGKTLLTDLITSGVSKAAGAAAGRARRGSSGGGYTDMGERGGQLAVGMIKKAIGS